MFLQFKSRTQERPSCHRAAINFETIYQSCPRPELRPVWILQVDEFWVVYVGDGLGTVAVLPA